MDSILVTLESYDRLAALHFRYFGMDDDEFNVLWFGYLRAGERCGGRRLYIDESGIFTNEMKIGPGATVWLKEINKIKSQSN